MIAYELQAEVAPSHADVERPPRVAEEAARRLVLREVNPAGDSSTSPPGQVEGAAPPSTRLAERGTGTQRQASDRVGVAQHDLAAGAIGAV
jgi:hypothetical protein